MKEDLVIVRSGGDIASGTIEKLFRSGFKVLVIEVKNPTAIRRKVAFGEAIYEGEMNIENIISKKVELDIEKDIESIGEESTKNKLNSIIDEFYKNKEIPVLSDEKALSIKLLNPRVVVDGILAKKNLGTNKTMAPITIAIGPGFIAAKDVDIVIETMRGHNLGRLIFEGSAEENTGIPGDIKGYTKERVIHSPTSGVVKNIKEIGDVVKKGEVIMMVGDTKVEATINGILRGIIRDGKKVPRNFKIADIDPRYDEKKNCFTISDKARAVGGGVLEAILYMISKNN